MKEQGWHTPVRVCDTCLETLQRQEEEERARTREEEDAGAGVDPFMDDSDSEVFISCAYRVLNVCLIRTSR